MEKNLETTTPHELDPLAPGARHGILTVVAQTAIPDGYGGTMVQCVCDCGTGSNPNHPLLIPKKRLVPRTVVKSCGCLRHRSKPKVAPGETIGDVEVLRIHHIDEQSRRTWTCKCSCGREFERAESTLARWKDKPQEDRYCGHPDHFLGMTFGKLTVAAYGGKRGKKHYYECMCVCGNSREVERSALTAPDPANMVTACKICSKQTSKIEEFVRTYLDEQGIEYIRQAGSFKNGGLTCINPDTGFPLTYDFEIKGAKAVIEVQGPQHFGYSETMHDGCIENFALQIRHDQMKRAYAEASGYRLLEIAYDQFRGGEYKRLVDRLLSEKEWTPPNLTGKVEEQDVFPFNPGKIDVRQERIERITELRGQGLRILDITNDMNVGAAYVRDVLHNVLGEPRRHRAGAA